MRQTFEDKISNATTLLDVLLILKDVTMLDTHVSTLAYVDSIIEQYNGTYGICKCFPFPLREGQEPYPIFAYFIKDMTDDLLTSIRDKQIVHIVYTDLNFINGLDKIDKTPGITNDLNTHNLKFAIIIGSSNNEVEPLTEEEREELLEFSY